MMSESSSSSAIVPVNEDNVKATVAVAAATAGFLVGGPIYAALAAAVGNYVANKVGTAAIVHVFLKRHGSTTTISFCSHGHVSTALVFERVV